jgi:hypothetical protein
MVDHTTRARARRHSIAVVLAGLVALPASVWSRQAQKPGGKPEVRLPGTDLALKSGWRLLFHDGCRFAVPESWLPTADGSSVVAPGGSNLSVRQFRLSSWAIHKSHIRAAYGHVTVLHEDSDRRLWFEIGIQPRVQHYVDVVNGLSSCVGLLEIRGPTTITADDVNRIVDSIGAAPTH